MNKYVSRCRSLSGFLAAALALAARPHLVRAQDSLPPVEQGVRIGITYTPGVRPGLLVLGGQPGTVLDSVRDIIRRDLDYSDRFELISLPGGGDDSMTIGISASSGAAVTARDANYPLYAAFGADYAVNVTELADSSLEITVFDVRGEGIRWDGRVRPGDLGRPEDPGFRMAVHRISDELVRAAAGSAGIAASRLLFVRGGGIYRVDSDGAGLKLVTPPGMRAFSPAWKPGGAGFVFMNFRDGALYEVDSTGSPRMIPPTADRQNFAPDVSPDGRILVFSRTTDDGTDIYSYDLEADCCLQRLTVGRFSDNLSPTFSPDGRRIAYVSTRAGLPQIYVMAADGTDQELFAPFDYGVTGGSNGPEWSPDGLSLAFHRDVEGTPQVFVMDVASRKVRQLTSAGRNEDPTWAPDGRHIAFVSSRTGTRQIWVIDLDTGRVRQLTRIGSTRLPVWSSRLEGLKNH